MAGPLDLANIMNPYASIQTPEESQAAMGNGLLNLSAGLLAGSGWQPHPVSFGSILGQSMIPAMQAQQQFSKEMLGAKMAKLQMDRLGMAINYWAGGQQPAQIPQQPTATDIQGNPFFTNQVPPYLTQNQQVNPQAIQAQAQSGLPAPIPINPHPGIAPGMVIGALSGDPGFLALGQAEQEQYKPITLRNGMVLIPGPNGGRIIDPTSVQATNLAHRIEASYDLVQVPMPDGTTQMMTKEQAAQRFGGQPPISGIPPAYGAPQSMPSPIPQTPSFASPSVPTMGGLGRSQTPKSAEEQKSFGEANVQMVKDINAKAEQAISDRARNQQMLDILDKGGVSLGPLSGQIAYTKNLLTEILGPDKVPSKDPTNTQEFNKYAYQGAIQVAKQAFGGRISTKEVELTINSMPGNNITEKANRAMLYFSNLQLDRNIAQQTELNKWMDDPVKSKQLERFPSYFNKTFPLAGIKAPMTATPNTAISGSIPAQNNIRRYNPATGRIE